MLNREVCVQCLLKNDMSIYNVVNGKEKWACAEDFVVYADNELPPDDCEYFLEHIVSKENENV